MRTHVIVLAKLLIDYNLCLLSGSEPLGIETCQRQHSENAYLKEDIFRQAAVASFVVLRPEET